MRAAHKMSGKLGRDILIGGTSLDIPVEFLDHLKVKAASGPPHAPFNLACS
jgi:hypothetical protein